MSLVLEGSCFYCKHLQTLKIMNLKGKHAFVCVAFPEGIPDEIQSGIYDHRCSHPEDNGLRFELKDRYLELPNWIDKMYPSEVEQDECYRLRKQIENERKNNSVADDK
jgi:hypothetical protein